MQDADLWSAAALLLLSKAQAWLAHSGRIVDSPDVPFPPASFSEAMPCQVLGEHYAQTSRVFYLSLLSPLRDLAKLLFKPSKNSLGSQKACLKGHLFPSTFVGQVNPDRIVVQGDEKSEVTSAHRIKR